MLDNCKGHEVIKICKGSDMCQLCFINVLKLKAMTNQNWHMSAPYYFLYSVSPTTGSSFSVLSVMNVFKVGSHVGACSGNFLYYPTSLPR